MLRVRKMLGFAFDFNWTALVLRLTAIRRCNVSSVLVSVIQWIGSARQLMETQLEGPFLQAVTPSAKIETDGCTRQS